MRQLKCNITIKEKRKNEYNKRQQQKYKNFDELRAIKVFVYLHNYCRQLSYDEMRCENHIHNENDKKANIVTIKFLLIRIITFLL